MVDLKVGWKAKRVGNEGYVREVRSDGTFQDFGPYPANTIPAFIHARKTLIEYMMRKEGAIKKSDTVPNGGRIPDNGQDQEPLGEQASFFEQTAKGSPDDEV